MKWTEEKDVILLTAMAGEGVFQWKHGSRERGGAWDVVAKNLNCQKEFSVNQRSLRDRFNTLARKVKAKLAKEERASGGGEVLQSESDKLVEELITLRDESEKKGEDQSEAKREAVVNEKKQALEMRDRALERIGETRKRNEEERAEEKKTVGRKRRRSGGDMRTLGMKVMVAMSSTVSRCHGSRTCCDKYKRFLPNLYPAHSK